MTTETRQPTHAHRGRRRLWTVGPAVLIAVAILITLKATSLSGLPEVGEPFDIDEFARPIPDEVNAFKFGEGHTHGLVKHISGNGQVCGCRLGVSPSTN